MINYKTTFLNKQYLYEDKECDECKLTADLSLKQSNCSKKQFFCHQCFEEYLEQITFKDK